MVMAELNMSGHIQKQLTRSLERILEEAHLSGELKLSGRKLKDFPKVKSGVKYNLCDTIIADLSKNRFGELPEEVTEFLFLEKLHLYHNAIRMIPETVVMLQSLSYLDLSRNQLTFLPREVCSLPLQILLVPYNRLESLPDEIGRMTTLSELDVGCNEIAVLPSRIGDLPRLRSLDLRHNILVQLPIELTYLRLVKLDISSNRISVLPYELRKMKCLIDIKLSDNPLTSPPASLCVRGRTHIFKYLEKQAMKQEKNKIGKMKSGLSEPRRHATSDTKTNPRSYNDIGSITNESTDDRWSPEITSDAVDSQKRYHKKKLERSTSEIGVVKMSLNHAHQNNHLSSHLDNILSQPLTGTSNHTTFNDIERVIPAVGNSEEKRLPNHTQTYKEYKEALRQQRVNENSSIYRPREQYLAQNSEFHANIGDSNSSNDSWTEKQIYNSVGNNKKDLDMINFISPNLSAISDNDYQYNGTGEQYPERLYEKLSPARSSSSEYMSRVPGAGVCYIDGNNDTIESNDSSKRNKSGIWSNSYSEVYSFTMRREFERAREEADLIDQLRSDIETRLKMALPKDLAAALADGVVLCHLANHVKPRSVSSIYVPSPAVPKLPVARCRRNVDNFLEACKKIGVDEEVLMDAEAIMDIGYINSYGMRALSHLISTLLHFHREEICEEIVSSRPSTNADHIFSAMLILIFLSSLILLYIFPMPN